MKTYSFRMVVEKDPETSDYIAHCAELPGCITCGKSIEETRVNFRDVLELYIADMVEHGDPIPQASGFLMTEEISVAVPA